MLLPCRLQKMAPFTKMTEMTPDNVVDYVTSFAAEVIVMMGMMVMVTTNIYMMMADGRGDDDEENY